MLVTECRYTGPSVKVLSIPLNDFSRRFNDEKCPTLGKMTHKIFVLLEIIGKELFS